MLDRPIIILGAGRSGTTMLKNALNSHSELHATEYELNYLWRYGNSRLPHDMLDPNIHFKEKRAEYIRNELAKYLGKNSKARLVEKTCANVLRVAYVHKILPDAKIIHLIRDGRAVAASAVERWHAKPTSRYFASKAKTIPIGDIARIGLSYLQNRAKAVFRGKKYIQSWGPRWPDVDSDVKKLSIYEVCAKQWSLSVQSAKEQMKSLPQGIGIEIRYEELCNEPVKVFKNLMDYLGVDANDPDFSKYTREMISQSSLDKWKKSVSDENLRQVENQAGGMLRELGYLK